MTQPFEGELRRGAPKTPGIEGEDNHFEPFTRVLYALRAQWIIFCLPELTSKDA